MLTKYAKFAAMMLVLCLVMTGCHFVGDPQAMPGVSGFFAGLWDGSVILFSVVMTIFTDVQIMDMHNNGLYYKVGYAVGVLCFAWNIGIAAGVTSLVLYVLPL